MYDSLIQEINNYIKYNANNEITGNGLNTILNSMLEALGAGMRFYGMASPTTTPVSNQYPKFYISFRPGTYSNFNFIGSQPSFVSGFAIIYDSDGSNTWRMQVKADKSDSDIFVINAEVKNSNLGSNIVFYVKNVERTNQISSFDIYAIDKTNNTEELIAVYSVQQTLSGYQTHKIDIQQCQNMTISLSVNWDVVELNTPVEYTYEESKFPSTAYVESPESKNIQAIESRVNLAERITGYRTDIDNDIFERTNTLGAYDYVSNNMTPDFLSPSSYSDAINTPWQSTNKRMYFMYPIPSTQKRYVLNLKPGNFPGQNVYYIYIPNISSVDHTVTINTYDSVNDTLLNNTLYTIHADSVLEVAVLIQDDIPNIHYSCREFIS